MNRQTSRDATPAYKRLAAELRAGILAGEFPPARRLPTDAELAAGRGLSRQTVRQAFGELVAEGLVYRVRGRGSFAVGSPGTEKYLRSLGSIEDLLALSVDTELEVVRPIAHEVDVAAAGRLRLVTDDVMTGVFRRVHAGVPFSVTTFYLPPELGRRVAADPRVSAAGAVSATTIIGLIEELSAVPVAGAHQSITASTAPPELAPLVDLPPDAAALRIDRLYFDAQGRAVELAVSYFNPERYSYRLELRRTVR